MANVLALHGGRIERGEVRDANGVFVVEPWNRIQHNRTLVGVFDAFAIGRRQHGDERFSLTAGLEHERFGLDALASREDVADGNTADIRHRHAVVKDLAIPVQFENQVAVLQAVLADNGTIGCSALVQTEDVGGTHIVLHNDPLDGVTELLFLQPLSVFP